MSLTSSNRRTGWPIPNFIGPAIPPSTCGILQKTSGAEHSGEIGLHQRPAIGRQSQSMPCRTRFRVGEHLYPLRIQCRTLRHWVPDPEVDLDDIIDAAAGRFDVVPDVGEDIGDLLLQARG